MKSRLIALLTDAIAIIEAADLEDTEAFLGQATAVLRAVEARKAVTEAFRGAIRAQDKQAHSKPAPKRNHTSTNAKAPTVASAIVSDLA